MGASQSSAFPASKRTRGTTARQLRVQLVHRQVQAPLADLGDLARVADAQKQHATVRDRLAHGRAVERAAEAGAQRLAGPAPFSAAKISSP